MAFLKKKSKYLSDRWLIIAMLFCVVTVSLCVWPNLVEISFHMNLIIEHEVVFPLLFVNKDTSVHNLLFYRKNTGLEQALCITCHVIEKDNSGHSVQCYSTQSSMVIIQSKFKIISPKCCQ